MAKSKSQNQAVNKVFMYLALIAAVVMLVIGGLALWANNFTSTMVKNELAAQKIYFPPAGSPGLDAKTYPDLHKYGGQLVDTPEEAHAYANGFIGEHLKKIAGGKVYAEVSAEGMKDPTNVKLQQQKQSLFQGETLRGILLTSGYGFGTVGTIAGIVAYTLFVGSALMVLTAVVFRSKL